MRVVEVLLPILAGVAAVVGIVWLNLARRRRRKRLSAEARRAEDEAADDFTKEW